MRINVAHQLRIYRGKAMFWYLKEAWAVLATAGSDWVEDKASRLGAALAFYSILSLAPLLVISIAVAAMFFDEAAARGELVTQMRGTVGTEGAKAIEAMLDNADKPKTGSMAAILGVITLLFGASGVFGQLQDAMNTIWEVKPKEGRGIWGMIQDRFLSLAMVFGTGFLLLISLVLSAGISGAGGYLGNIWPGFEAFWHFAHGIVSFLIITLLFALIFKFLPDAQVSWRDVWVGAALTAALFTIGKLLIGLYLGKSAMSSAYGAAGSFVILVVWIYYSAQILFFGAEITQVFAKRYGTKIVPKPGATAVTEEKRAQEGLTSHGKARPA